MDGWEIVTEERFHLAEGARWHQGRLLFVDLRNGNLYTAGSRTRRLLSLGTSLGAVAPVAGGGWIAAAGSGIALIRDGEVAWLASAGQAGEIRMNDAVCDPYGRFWAGSMALDGRVGAGALYRVDPNGSAHQVLTGLGVPNGPAFTACGTRMYLADSARGTIRRFEVDPVSGSLDASEVFARWHRGEGKPDGLCVDDDDHLWVAVWGAGEVHRYAPDGRLVRRIRVPTAQPTSVALGQGALYVTTARYRMDEPDPLAGAVLSRPSLVSAPAAIAYQMGSELQEQC
ncbi:SMP-30/gluconolactonase/LRE family protein [Amycolatopsis oliviviridis]|uniref:Calcium-binding protein n=1 Tax=Amycolatopsis oliviviridis TaxID=1471590 RepID=A0ABQ3LGI7_9PSEU|nr:SMP-30/gluconolactonase/LRE family protein [Amycolatopsis oliviviridis]GHH14741.1 calcium-binding protein [Amycolatopsis oliviviridis]